MLRIATDENFDGHVLRGLLSRIAGLDVVRVQDTEAYSKSDSKVLEWAAREGRVLLTRDKKTMVPPATRRVQAGKPMAGVIILLSMPVGQAIEELALAIQVYEQEDMSNQVLYLPI